MFTGIVKGLYKVKGIKKKEDFLVISIDLKDLNRKIKTGESVSVNGACLTAVRIYNKAVFFEIMGETLKKTNLISLKIGDMVNIEQSLKLGERLDGHFVLGHVDGRGKIEKKIITKDNCFVWISLPKNLQYGLIPKGSIGVDGVSLTIAAIQNNKFAVALIPHTLKITTLGYKEKGDYVNIEIDYPGKWIKKLLKNSK